MQRIADQKGEKLEAGKDKEHTDRAAPSLALDTRVAGLTPGVRADAASAG